MSITEITGDDRPESEPIAPRPLFGKSQGKRPGSRTFDVCCRPHLVSSITRVGLTLDRILREELDDWREGLEYAREHDDEGVLDDEDDLVVFEGNRVRAVIRQSPGDDMPQVVRFGPDARADVDKEEAAPSPNDEAGHLAAPTVSSSGLVLTEDERFLLALIRHGTYRDAIERLTLSGRYAELGAALGWWGSQRAGASRSPGA